jgi:hypothetical protein
MNLNAPPPKDSWMMNVQIIAQGVHFLLGFSAILLTALIGVLAGYPTGPVEVALGVVVVLAAVKEFFYDIVYELPKQTWGDSIMDFAFYLLGAAVATGIYALAYRLTHRL